jgi:hypothetical protein
VKIGLLDLFLQHTPPPLSINENADPTVPVDLDRVLASLARGGKASPGEPGVSAPPIVDRPALVPAGVVTDGLKDVMDLPPALAQPAGADLPKDSPLGGSLESSLLARSFRQAPIGVV